MLGHQWLKKYFGTVPKEVVTIKYSYDLIHDMVT